MATDFAARDSARLIGGDKKRMKKMKNDHDADDRGKKKGTGMRTLGMRKVKSKKKMMTTTKKVAGTPKMGTGGLSTEMKSNKGMGHKTDRDNAAQMAKHGMRGMSI